MKKSDPSRWLGGLNPEQGEAVLHDDGPLLILAGAGSGKTTVLVARTGRLLSSGVCPADGMLVLTFTNKAAKELKHRVAAKVGADAKGLWAGTFHSFGLFLLKQFHEAAGLNPRFAVIDATDSASILKELMKEVRVGGKDRFDIDKLLNKVNDLRSGDARKTEATDEYDELAEVLAPRFDRRLDLLGVVDFEALLLKPMEMFQEHPDILEKVRSRFQQVMVDEFQDTNRVQMKLVHALADGHQNITVVGDDDQSIYGWRGAQVSNILQFPSEFKNCKVVKLERNYRSSPQILRLANEVIAKNSQRHGKVLKPQDGREGDEVPELFIIENEEDEAEFVVRELMNAKQAGQSFREMAVLYRSNTQGGFIESALRRQRIDYSISGGTSIFDRKEAKDMLSYLRASLTGDEVAFRRIMNTPARGVGDTTLERLAEFSKANKLGFQETAKRWKDAGVQDRSGEGLDSLFNILQTLPGELLNGTGTAGERFLKKLDQIGYRQEVMTSGSQPGAGEKKWMICEITARILDSYISKRKLDRGTLKDFVDAMTLREDEEEDGDHDKVSLMTLHASKGLKFPLVILTGIEEDILPHQRLGSDIDEERRLFYVGITRAKTKLILSRCQVRKRHGALKASAPSRFLLDLPAGLFREHAGAFRPVSGQEREDLVSGFLAKFQAKSGPVVK